MKIKKTLTGTEICGLYVAAELAAGDESNRLAPWARDLLLDVREKLYKFRFNPGSTHTLEGEEA